MSEKFIFEITVGKKRAHQIIFPTGNGRRELRAVGGTLVGYAVLKGRKLTVEFVDRAAEKLIEGQGCPITDL